MWLFKRKKKEKDTFQKDMIAGKIARAMVAIQIKFANAMNKLFSKTSPRRMKLYSFLFSIVGFGLSLYFIAIAISNYSSGRKIKVEQAKIPRVEGRNDNQNSSSNILIDEQTWKKIESFKEYVDSLKQNGSKEVDSLIAARPGLLDSISMLEEIYYSQKTK
jgi:hypothetical protein